MNQDAPIDHAVRLLRDGKLVAFATETVYGLGADARSPAAVKRIFAAKGRPSNNPLIVHVPDERVARRYAAHWPVHAHTLARAFWPGPLTLVVERAGGIADEVTAGGQTVGLRVPSHALALRMLSAFDGPVAAPSANRSNGVSPTTAAHVLSELADRVDYILDGGSCAVGIESTVVDVTGAVPVVLRLGSVTVEMLRAAAGHVEERTSGGAGVLRSPGMMARHYSPRAPLYLYDANEASRVTDWIAKHGHSGARVLALGENALQLPEYVVISMPTNPADYANILYATLHALDHQGVEAIWVERPPQTASWAAIQDRLNRASIHI